MLGVFFLLFCQDVFEDKEEVKSVTNWGVLDFSDFKSGGENLFILLVVAFIGLVLNSVFV